MMNLSEVKKRLIELDKSVDQPFIVEFDTIAGDLTLYITDRFKCQCRKGNVWESNETLPAIKNAPYGYDYNKNK